MESLQTLIFYPLKLLYFERYYLGSSRFLDHGFLVFFAFYETSYRLIQLFLKIFDIDF